MPSGIERDDVRFGIGTTFQTFILLENRRELQPGPG
jgi:hypothetical protein